MPKRALYEKRPYLLAAFVAALAYYYLRAGPWPELWFIPLKGAALVLLALYAFMRHSGRGARLVAVMMLIAAAGEMILEFDGAAGHVIYLGYHIAALVLYLRYRREMLTASQKLTAATLLVMPPLILSMAGGEVGGGFMLVAYGLVAGAMAAGAWSSSFPRYRVGVGAVLILTANLLYFFGMGILQGSILPQIFAWPVTFVGQFLICTGVIQTLRKRELGENVTQTQA